MTRYVDLFGRECEEPRGGNTSRRVVRTLADELRALRAWMRKKDADPLHGWTPCGRAHSQVCKGSLAREHAVGARLWREYLKRRAEASRQ